MNAAEYARYSTGNQTENSIEYQLDAIRKYCAENDITITATYIDRAESGTNTDREDFQRMLAAAKRKSTWERVQRRMSDNKRNASNKAKRTYLLTGMIECEECGGAYVGHTSRNKKGVETRYYVCGNRYRTHTCHGQSVNADWLEREVVEAVREYLNDTEFEAEAQRIADQVNNSSPELTAERAELAGINAKLSNGLRAILNGFNDFPELHEEMDRLRVRKGELEDIIGRRTARRTPVDPKSIVKIFRQSTENWDTDLRWCQE